MTGVEGIGLILGFLLAILGTLAFTLGVVALIVFFAVCIQRGWRKLRGH